MLKHLLQKILGSALHSKHGRYRHSSSSFKRHSVGRHSSSDGYGNAHRHQGHGYYKNKHRHSSS